MQGVHQGRSPRGAVVAIHNKLHIQSDGWQLRPRLETIRDREYKGAVAVAYKDGEPVAVVLVRLTRDGKSPHDIAAFCKPAYRRQGISSQLIKALAAQEVPFPGAVMGLAGSDIFWRQNGIKCRSYL